MKNRFILLLTAIVMCAAPATALRYHDAALNHIKGPVKAVYDDGELTLKYTADGKEIVDNPNHGYVYDSNGYPIQSIDGNTKYSYQNGRLVQATYKSSTGLTTTRYYYDASGNLLKYENYRNKDPQPFGTTYFYDIETDSYGNRTKYTRKSEYGAIGLDPTTYTIRYEYYTEGSKPEAKPATPRQAAKPQARGELSILEFFEHPCGDNRLSWNMNFTEASNAIGSSAKKIHKPSQFFKNKDSEGTIYLEGTTPIDLGLTGFKAYLLDGAIDYRGRSLNTLKYNFATVWIAFYKDNEEYTPGQDKRNYCSSHSRLTQPGQEAYDFLIEKLKESGARIRKWKYNSDERVKSCMAVYNGRVFLLMLNKDYAYGNYFIEIKTADYYTENM